VEDKTNEIAAIPELLDSLNVKGHIITIDAMVRSVKLLLKFEKNGRIMFLCLGLIRNNYF